MMATCLTIHRREWEVKQAPDDLLLKITVPFVSAEDSVTSAQAFAPYAPSAISVQFGISNQKVQ